MYFTKNKIFRGKFTQNAKLRHMLEKTGQKELVYHSKDGYWGDCGCGEGKNHLGRRLWLRRVKNRPMPIPDRDFDDYDY